MYNLPHVQFVTDISAEQKTVQQSFLLKQLYEIGPRLYDSFVHNGYMVYDGVRDLLNEPQRHLFLDLLVSA